MLTGEEINFDGINGKEAYFITGEYRQKTTPVGNFSSNSLGLHDMSGNVWELCWDWYGTYPTSSQTDPQGPGSGSRRVYRGGSWSDYPVHARCASGAAAPRASAASTSASRLARAAR
ncbi:MAG: SUMF1/EgtB/PvdO family nonheme iron enzyme [Saprospiraceae bacterium]|nr:SUMF1/EgtB/PvdO family nonheme iron enzyme [Saprospiraceae bacterium]